MKQRYLRSTSILVVLLWIGGPCTAQTLLPYRARLYVKLVWNNPVYGDDSVQGEAMVLRGEPLVLDIGIRSLYPEVPAAAEADWPQRISVHLARGDFFDHDVRSALPLQCATGSMRDSGVDRSPGYVGLQPGGFSDIRCRVPDAAVAALAGGTYVITIDWTLDDDAQRFREEKGVIEPRIPLLSGYTVFELREVRSGADELDLLDHLALHALREGDFSRAVQVANELLRKKPSSFGALATRARARAASGNCRQARADWERAATILERNEDTGNSALERLTFGVDERPVSAEAWRQQARTLGCAAGN